MDDLDKLLNDLQGVAVTEAPTSLSLEDMLDSIQDQIPSSTTVSSRSKNRLAALQKPKHKVDKMMSDTDRQNTCHVCRKPIEKAGAVLNSKTFHPEHFTCTVCDRSLKGVLAFDRDDKLWCEVDYYKTFSPECSYCNEPIRENNAVEAAGKTYHPDHFFCAHCGDSLVHQTFMEYQGKAFCSEDYSTLFASKCAHCMQPLLEDYVTALSKNYHKNHFICSVYTS